MSNESYILEKNVSVFNSTRYAIKNKKEEPVLCEFCIETLPGVQSNTTLYVIIEAFNFTLSDTWSYNSGGWKDSFQPPWCNYWGSFCFRSRGTFFYIFLTGTDSNIYLLLVVTCKITIQCNYWGSFSLHTLCYVKLLLFSVILEAQILALHSLTSVVII